MSLPLYNIKSSLPAGGLLRERTWRLSPDALVLGPDAVEEIRQLGHILHRFIESCNQLYYGSLKGKYPEFISRLLDQNKHPQVQRLGAKEVRKDAFPLFFRPDLLMTDSGIKMCELDGVPGGLGILKWLLETYQHDGTFRLVTDLQDEVGFAQFFEGFDAIYGNEAEMYVPELEYFFGAENVFKAWEYDFGQRPVFRFFEMVDWIQYESLVKSWERSTWTTPPLKAFLEEKMWLAFLWLPSLEAHWIELLGAKYFSQLRSVVPRSWVLQETRLDPFKVIPWLNLPDFRELKNRQRYGKKFVIKESGYSQNSWGSKGVTMGNDLSTVEWGKSLENAIKGSADTPQILQELTMPRIVKHTRWNEDSGDLESFEGRARLSPYYVRNGKEILLAGIMATICPANKKIIHGMRDSVIVPVAVRSG